MQILETFPTEFFIFENAIIDNQSLIDKIKEIKKTVDENAGHISLLINLKNYSEFNNLISWFEQCLNDIRQHMKYDCDEFKITNSWANCYLAKSGTSINMHRHSMSFLSGIYYLTDGSPTVFEDPVIHRSQAQLEVLRFDYSPHIPIEAQPGKLCIFPSWMFHSSIPHYGSEDRYIISFNSLPSGHINYTMATDSRADIIVK